MKIEEFIAEVVSQIYTACIDNGAEPPNKIELTIQLNSKGEVCMENEISIGTVKIEL